MKRGISTFISSIQADADIDDDNEWGEGFRVWNDVNGDGAYDPDDDEEIYLFTSVGNNITIDLSAIDGQGNNANLNEIRIDSRGRLKFTGNQPLFAPLSLNFCNSKSSAKTGRLATASTTGQITISTQDCT